MQKQRQQKPPIFLQSKRNHLLASLSLHLIGEVKISLIEVVNTNITILSSRSVRFALWVHRDCVQRTEMSTYTADLLFEHLVVESRFKLSLTCGCSCDIHSGLSASEDYEVLLGGNGCGVERGVGYVGLHDFEVAGIDEL